MYAGEWRKYFIRKKNHLALSNKKMKHEKLFTTFASVYKKKALCGLNLIIDIKIVKVSWLLLTIDLLPSLVGNRFNRQKVRVNAKKTWH